MDDMTEKPDTDDPVTLERKDAASFDAMADFKEVVMDDSWQQHRSPEYFEYRRMWEEVPATKTVTDFPLNVDIETTDVCNLACPMCPRTIKAEAGELEDRLMTRDEYRSIIDQCATHGAKAVKLNYDGEPLAHRDIVWQVQYAKDRGILDVLVNTNATLLRGDKAEPLLAAGVDCLIVSFDAVSPDLFAEQRVGTTIGRVIDNVYDFVRLRNAKYPKTTIRLQMVMYDDPKWQRQFTAMQTMWGHLVDSIGYSPLVDYDLREYPEVKGWWCAQPFQRMVLKINGSVTVCCPDSFDDLSVGNWRETPLYDLWHSERFNEIRRLHAEGKYHSIDRCRTCSYAHLEKNV